MNDIKDRLAKLLATENITVRHSASASTASFDVKDRVLVLPVWKNLSKDGKLSKDSATDVYDLLVGHEVGHALYTPYKGWESAIVEGLNKNILNIKYKPDFIGNNFVIECKGRPNESFPLRWKLFKKLMAEDYPKTTLYKPQNQKECDETIKLILGNQKS